MARNKISVNINMNKISKIPNLGEFEDAVRIGIKQGKRELRERLVMKMQENLIKYGLGDSSFMSQIVTSNTADGVVVRVASKYVMYVEFGTGVIGASSPHPNPWAYDIKNHGEEGWIFKAENGRFYRTRGQEARPFMYETWSWGKRNATRIVENCVMEQIEKVSRRMNR